MQNSDADGSRQARIFFREFAEFFQRFIPRVSTTTITVTQEQTKSQVQTLTTTNTFFIQRCTPSPFPYRQCPHRHTSSPPPITTSHDNPHTKTRHPTSTQHHTTTTSYHHYD